MLSDNYKKTQQAYCDLGKQYIENSASIDLPLLPEFMKLLPKGGKVLDAGCAGGRDSYKFVHEGFLVTGIDVVDVFIEEAIKKVSQAKFIKMDLLNLKFPKNYFDAIWAQAILLHMGRKDIPKILETFHNILKKNGKIHIAVKKGNGSGWKADKLSNNKKRFFTYFSKKEIENYITAAGFKVIFSGERADDAARKNIKWIIVWAEKN